MFHLFAYLQDEWLSCMILARQRVILQDLARFCQNLAGSCKITIRCRLGFVGKLRLPSKRMQGFWLHKLFENVSYVPHLSRFYLS